MLNAPKTCPWKCEGSQTGSGRAGSSGVGQNTTNKLAPCIGLWVELHSKESECILRLSTHQQKIIKLWELWRALEYSGALQRRAKQYCLWLYWLCRGATLFSGAGSK